VDARESRLAKNEAVFREINERVNELAASHGTDAHVYAFFCECSDADCTRQLELTRDAYEEVRARGNRFLVASGHQLPELETAIERRDEWLVVEKQNEAGKLARQLDPRNGEG
jgi:hypothetical protein